MKEVALKSAQDLALMAEGGKILADIMQKVAVETKAGQTAVALEELCRKLIKKYRAEPAFLGYIPYPGAKPYPASLCVSINEELVHGVPDRRVFKSGDVVKLDLGIKYRGFYLDMALTVAIPPVSPKVALMISVAKEALEKGISQAVPGNRIGDIGYTIYNTVKKEGFYVAQGLTGHGIGRSLHEPPSVYNKSKRGEGEILKAGMVIAIEPMIIMGTEEVIEKENGCFISKDGSLTAHFEHTVAIVNEGPKVLTAL